MRALELKVPPPLVALCVGLMMWLASDAVASVEVPLLLRVGICAAFVGTGLGLDIAALLAFRRAKTTVNPFRPRASSSLVTRGVYTFTRNPMYLGLLLLLLGLAAFLANPLALVLPAVFVAYINRFQITPEERTLSSLFGDAFSEYKAKVRRWL